MLKSALVRISYGFGRKRGANLIIFARNVVLLMTGLVPFTDPSPMLTALAAAIDLYESLVEKAMSGDRQAIQARNEQFVVLKGLLRDLAAYVQNKCGNSAACLTSTGFDVIKPRSAPQQPGVPTKPRLEQGPTSGSLMYRFTRGKNVSNYSIQIAQNAAGPWTDRPLSTKANLLIDGLTPLTNYWARARANAAKGSSDWTEPTCKIVM